MHLTSIGSSIEQIVWLAGRLPIHFALGAIKYLHFELVWQAPVHTGLFGLSRVTCWVIHTHSANLRAHRQDSICLIIKKKFHFTRRSQLIPPVEN